ncbi:MAG: hypothetical protein ACIAQF_12255 [Phycisphaerales bacterium JB065]
MTDPSKRQSYQHHAAGLTPEERQLAHRLDALGEADRGSVPSGLEDRVFTASASHLPAPKPLGGAALFSARSWHAWVALAACFLIATGIGWFTLTPGGGGHPPPSGNGSSIALAELEAEVGFTLDALLASYDFEVAESTESGSSDASSVQDDSFWGTTLDDEFLNGFETEVSL